MVNEERVRATVAAIEADPVRWDQGYWGERFPDGPELMCFGGWALTLFLPDKIRWDGWRMVSTDLVWSLYGLAAELLSFNDDQAEALFGWIPNPEDHTIENLKWRITRATGVTFET